MNPHVRKTPQARRDLAALAAYIAEGSLEASDRFLAAFDATCQILASDPEIGERCRFAGLTSEALRIWQVRKFRNYLILYRPAVGEIDVVRVVHAGRDLDTLFLEDEGPPS